MRLTQADLNKILEEHKIWIESFGSRGEKANLVVADLSELDLRYADLRYANLSYADLSYADLRYANLRYADLSYADLRYADLRYANLPESTFVIMGEQYPIIICNGEYVRAGCQNHIVEDWFSKSYNEVMMMDGRSAIKYYPRLLDIIDFYLPTEEKRVRPDWLTAK